MGFFDKLKKKSENIAQGLWNQANPFDGGKTYSNPQGNQAVPQQVQQKIQNAKYGVLANNPQRQNAFLNGIKPTQFNALGAVTPELKKAGTTIGLGAVRSGTGLAQGISGLYDLATPGVGTNRFSKKLDSFAKFVDDTNKAEEGNSALYKGSQLGTDLLTFGAPGKVIKGVGVVGSKVPQLAKAGNAVSKVAAPVSKVTTPIAKQAGKVNAGIAATGGTGRVIAAANKGIGQSFKANNLLPNALIDLGQPASKGRDIGPEDVAISLGANAALGATPAVAKQLVKNAGIARQAGIKNAVNPTVDTDFAAEKALNNRLRQEATDPKRRGERARIMQELQASNQRLGERAQYLQSKTGTSFGSGPTNPFNNAKARNAGLATDPLESLKQEARKYKKIYHGTDKVFDEFDVKKSADGGIWFTDRKDLIAKGEVGASGKGQVVERYIDENNLKLANWDDVDRYTDGQLINMGYDGYKLVDDVNKETTYKLFDPSKAQKPDLYNQATASRNPFKSQGGYIKNPMGKEPKPVLPAVVQEYAQMLKSMDDGARGGQMVGNYSDGYKRVTEHSKFYSDHFAKTGRKPTQADWLTEAERQLKSGKADSEFQKAYADQTNPEVASLLQEADKGALKPGGVVISEAVNKGSGTKVQRGIEVVDGKPKRFERTVPTDKLAQRATQEVPKQDVPNISDQPIELKSIQGKNPLDTTPEKVRFTELSNEFLGSIKSGEINAADRAKTYNKGYGKLTSKQKNEVLFGKDDPRFKKDIKDGNTLAAIDYLDREFNDAYRYFTKEKGIKMGYQDSYLPRIYENKLGDKITSAEYRLLQKSTGRQKGRTGADLQEWKLVTRDPAELMKMYYNSLEKAAAGKQFLNKLQNEGFVISSSEPVRGMRPVIAEGMQDNGMIYYARKDVADKLNTMFGTKESSNIVNAAMEKGAGVNSLFQSVVLSGGIPNTPINAFGIMQVMKETMTAHPIKAGKALYAGMSKSFSDKLFTEKADVLKLMAKNGIDPRVDLDQIAKRGFQRAMEKEGVAQKTNAVWDEITNDATFRRFMPALEVQHFENIYKAGVKKGLNETEAARIAAESTKNFYGKNSMAKEAFRPELVTNTSGALLFAPRFRESMLNFWGKNAAALKPGNITKPEYRDNVKFMASAAVMFAAYDVLNKELNGTHLWENPDGKKDKLLIPGGENGKTLGIPFLPSIATVPRNAGMFAVNTLSGNWGEAGKNAGAFASMPVKLLTELANNENYFGQRIIDEKASTPEKLTQGLSHIAKGTMQPWVREGLNVAGQDLPEGVKKSLGIKEKGAWETAANALETPVRFYDPAYFRGGSDKFRFADGTTQGQKRAATSDSRDSIIEAALNTPEARAFFKNKDAVQKELAANDPELQALYDQRKAMLTGLGNDKVLVNKNLTAQEIKSINSWNRLTTEAKNKIAKTDPGRKKQYEIANLKHRFTKGEIDQEEYDKKLATLNKVKKANTGRKSGGRGRKSRAPSFTPVAINAKASTPRYVKVAPVKKAVFKGKKSPRKATKKVV